MIKPKSKFCISNMKIESYSICSEQSILTALADFDRIAHANFVAGMVGSGCIVMETSRSHCHCRSAVIDYAIGMVAVVTAMCSVRCRWSLNWAMSNWCCSR